MARFKTGAKWTGAGVGICCSFLVAYEGYEPIAKHERVDPPSVVTVCYGRTNYDDKSLQAGKHYTKAECEAFLKDDLQKYASPVIACIPTFNSMPPHRQAALVSFAYNLGAGRLCKSNVARNLNAGNVRNGCNAMLAYTRANGAVLKGLVRRRQDERAMCMRND